ncbi:hypothetical protein F4703DRAFT_1263135 [Phycomyces blakesleeanus]
MQTLMTRPGHLVRESMTNSKTCCNNSKNKRRFPVLVLPKEPVLHPHATHLVNDRLKILLLLLLLLLLVVLLVLLVQLKLITFSVMKAVDPQVRWSHLQVMTYLILCPENPLLPLSRVLGRVIHLEQSRNDLESWRSESMSPSNTGTELTFVDYAIARFDYAAKDEDEISFTKGDLLGIIDKNEDGWWLSRRWEEASGWSEQGTSVISGISLFIAASSS